MQSYKLIIMLIFGYILGMSSVFIIQSQPRPQISPSVAFNQRTNNSITGTYFPQESLCIVLTDRNEEAIMNSLDHEYLHHLIIDDMMCGNETCREHFCER